MMVSGPRPEPPGRTRAVRRRSLDRARVRRGRPRCARRSRERRHRGHRRGGAAHAGGPARLEARAPSRAARRWRRGRRRGCAAGPWAGHPRPRSTRSASWRASGSPARARSRRSPRPSADIDDAPLLLDGNYDWLSASIERRARVVHAHQGRPRLRVGGRGIRHREGRTATAACAGRTTRLPLYSWDENKGYSSPAHFAAIDEHGPSGLHRTTWLHDRSEAAPALFDLGVGWIHDG